MMLRPRIKHLCFMLSALAITFTTTVDRAEAGLFSNDAEDMVEEGIALLGEGKQEEAEARFLGAIEEDSQVEDAYYQLGLINFQKQNYMFASNMFRREFQVSSNGESLYRQAICLVKLDRSLSAIDVLAEAVDAMGGDLESSDLLRDPALEPLRGKGPFKKLVDSMKLKEQGMLEYLSETITEIKLAIVSLRRAMDFALELARMVGFRVAVLLAAIFLLTAGLNLSGLTYGRAGFLVSLLSVFFFYYYFSKMFSVEHSADLMTIVETFGWLMLPLVGLYLVGRLTSRTGHFLQRRLVLNRAYRKTGSLFLPAEKGSDKSIRRAVYRFDDLAEQYLTNSFTYLSAEPDSDARRSAQLEREKLRNAILDLLAKSQDKHDDTNSAPDRNSGTTGTPERSDTGQTGEFTMD
jgi:tetratricopeptide (TPR) repeat protein